MKQILRLKMGQFAVSKEEYLSILGLGSCIALVLYDDKSRVASMSHIVLPKANSREGSPFKYADLSVRTMIQEMKKFNIRESSLKAKIAGGSDMFNSITRNHAIQIGQLNIEEVRRQLSIYKIPILAESTGGNFGRTVTFNPKTCNMKIRIIGKEEFII